MVFFRLLIKLTRSFFCNPLFSERRLASRSQLEIEKLASSAQIEADEAADKAIDLHEQLEGVLVRRPSQNEAQQMIHTAKAERRMREKAEREGEATTTAPGEEDLTPAEKRALDAERRAAWRKARLKSLENDAIQAQMVIQKMSELGMSSPTEAEAAAMAEELGAIREDERQPLYANTDDSDNANVVTEERTADRENNTIPVSELGGRAVEGHVALT